MELIERANPAAALATGESGDDRDRCSCGCASRICPDDDLALLLPAVESVRQAVPAHWWVSTTWLRGAGSRLAWRVVSTAAAEKSGAVDLGANRGGVSRRAASGKARI